MTTRRGQNRWNTDAPSPGFPNSPFGLRRTGWRAEGRGDGTTVQRLEHGRASACGLRRTGRRAGGTETERQSNGWNTDAPRPADCGGQVGGLGARRRLKGFPGLPLPHGSIKVVILSYTNPLKLQDLDESVTSGPRSQSTPETAPCPAGASHSQSDCRTGAARMKLDVPGWSGKLGRAKTR